MSALLYVLLSWARRGGRRVLASGTRYALSRRRGRKPDMFLTRDRELPARGAIPHPPDIMVEVISLSERIRCAPGERSTHSAKAFIARISEADPIAMIGIRARVVRA